MKSLSCTPLTEEIRLEMFGSPDLKRFLLVQGPAARKRGDTEKSSLLPFTPLRGAAGT